ncbi:MAG: hypothetical protein LH471_09820 [Salinibacterium sp.]|nr:hypothetical protein [Salinibacterium sp.]
MLKADDQPEVRAEQENRREVLRAVVFSVVPLLAVLVASLLVIVSTTPY